MLCQVTGTYGIGQLMPVAKQSWLLLHVRFCLPCRELIFMTLLPAFCPITEGVLFRLTKQRKRRGKKVQMQMDQMTVGSCGISSISVSELHRH